MESIVRLTQLPHWERLKEEGRRKIVRVESSMTRLLFTSSAEIDPKRVEYDRGFRQGIMYILEGLPNEVALEWNAFLKAAQTEKEVD